MCELFFICVFLPNYRYFPEKIVIKIVRIIFKGAHFMRDDHIFIVTTIEKIEETFTSDGRPKGWVDFGDVQGWGFFFDKAIAINALSRNVEDMREGNHQYAVIEEHCPGIGGTVPNSIMWFKWNPEKKGYFPIPTPEKPKSLRLMTGFVIS